MRDPRNCKHMVALYLRCEHCEEEDALRARVRELEAEKLDAFRMVAAIVAAAGGEVHVSPVHMIEPYTLTRDDQSMGATIFRAFHQPKP